MTNFSEEIVRDILSSADIVDIISTYIPLQLSGKNYRALCPFHSEKTPSFMVSREKQIYHCFGCGEGGNAITFLMKYERMSFPEALRNMAERAGVRLPEKRYGGRERSPSPKLDLYEIHVEACSFYQEQLHRIPDGIKAADYLRSRGIGEEAWDRFRLGYAPPSWDSLIRHLRTKGRPLPLLEAAGLILPGRRPGTFFDRFRDRLMVPILDAQGRVLGFGGRDLHGDENKYMNSPTTAIYNKGETLYGLNFAHKKIRDEGQALIVEGYFDLISLHLSGWEGTVASLGTSLTSGQARLLRRYTDRVLLLFDSDPAGIKASMRSIEVLLEEGLSLKVARLPGGHDPDSLLRKGGCKEMIQVLNQARDWLDFMWETRDEEGQFIEIGEEVRQVRGILLILARTRDRLSKAKYLKKLAEKSGLGEDILLREMREAEKGGSWASNAPVLTPLAFPAEERRALEIALLFPEKRDRWAKILDPSEISNPHLRKVFSLYFQHGGEREEEFRRILCQEADDEVRSLCTGIWARGEDDMGNVEEAFTDCILRIRERREKANRSELRRKILEAEQAGDSMAVFKLIRDHPSLKKKTLNR